MPRACFEASYVLRYSARNSRMMPCLRSDHGWGSRVVRQQGWVKDVRGGNSNSEETCLGALKGSRTLSVSLGNTLGKAGPGRRTLTLVRRSPKQRCKNSGYTGYTCWSTFTRMFLKIPLGYRPGWWGVEFWLVFFELLALVTWDTLNQPLTGGDEEGWEMIQQEHHIYGYKGKMTSGKQENVSYFYERKDNEVLSTLWVLPSSQAGLEGAWNHCVNKFPAARINVTTPLVLTRFQRVYQLGLPTGLHPWLVTHCSSQTASWNRAELFLSPL